MRTLLIPTDFSENSLDLLRETLGNLPDEKLNIVLACGYKLSTNRLELLQMTSSRLLQSVTTKKFFRQLDKIKLDFCRRVTQLRIEFFTGTNAAAFNNFLELHQITDAIVPPASFLTFEKSELFDISKFIRGSKVNSWVIEIENEEEKTPQLSVSAIFTNA